MLSKIKYMCELFEIFWLLFSPGLSIIIAILAKIFLLERFAYEIYKSLPFLVILPLICDSAILLLAKVFLGNCI